MNPRFFPRYNVEQYDFDLFFLGQNPKLLPEIDKILDVSLSGIRLKVRGSLPQFNGAKVCLKFKNHTLYFQSRLVWTKDLSQDESEIGLKLIIPTPETFQKWVSLIEAIDINTRKQVEKTKKDSTALHASSY